MFGTKVEEAAAAIEKLAARELLLMQQRHAACVKARAAEVAAGDEYLDNEAQAEPGPSVAAVVKAQAEISAIDGGLRACRARRLQAVKTKRLAEAAALRKQAGELRDQAASIRLRVAQAITLVNSLEAVEVTVSPARAGDVPLSQKLEARTDEMERRAAGLEGDVPRSGVVDVEDATNVEPLIAAVLRHESDGPDAGEILAWAEACEFLSGKLFGDHARRFRLAWRDGAIDLAESYTQVPQLVKTSIGTFGTTRFESGSDLFRAAA